MIKCTNQATPNALLVGHNGATPMSTAATVENLKRNSQDFEWYPTTQAMLECIKSDLPFYTTGISASVNIIDCGAGDGRVLDFLAGDGDKFAIEKSKILLSKHSKDITPIGTDFYQCTLIDKAVDVVFSNPPYSEYELWASKIIKEANAPVIYLIIPERWTESESIKSALEQRRIKDHKVIYKGDFMDAERKARARINIVRIDTRSSTNRWNRQDKPTVDPFDLWFDECFPQPKEARKEARKASKESVKEKLSRELTDGSNLIEVLVSLYNRDMEKLQHNYTAALSLDPSLMHELDIKVSEIAKAVKQKITGLKNLYWKELFGNYESITNRLSSPSRQSIFNKLSGNTHVDFNIDTAYAVTMWVIRNANHYYDQQLVDLVESMVKKANIALYKSNRRTFGDEEWRYGWYEKPPKSISHYQLEYRIVLEYMGGIVTSQWSYEKDRYHGITEKTYNFINDVLVIARNLGFSSTDEANSFQWESGKANDFHLNKGGTLMSVRAFKNGNIHIKFDQAFMRRLNVEFGRLKGWVKDWSEAAQEMGIPEEEAKQSFNSSFRLGNVTALLLTTQNPNMHNHDAANEAEDRLQASKIVPVAEPVTFKETVKPKPIEDTPQPLVLAGFEPTNPEFQHALF